MLVEGFWKVVQASGADNTEDLFTFKSTFNMMKSMGKIDDETKEIMSEAIKLFMKAIRKMTKDNKEVRKENRRKRREKKRVSQNAVLNITTEEGDHHLIEKKTLKAGDITIKPGTPRGTKG